MAEPISAAGGALLAVGGLLRRAEVSADGRTMHQVGGRAADVFYRDRWSYDKVVRSTHGVNCTGSCSWKVYVKDGIISAIFESKAARIALPGRLSYPALLKDTRADVGHALAKQVPVTAELIHTGDQAYPGHELPTDVYAVVVTAEPHLMIGSDHYRGEMPDPGCP